MTPFDMDIMSNPHVQGGYMNLVSLLSAQGLTYGTYLWGPQYKGLDDYIWEHCFQPQALHQEQEQGEHIQIKVHRKERVVQMYHPLFSSLY